MSSEEIPEAFESQTRHDLGPRDVESQANDSNGRQWHPQITVVHNPDLTSRQGESIWEQHQELR